MTTGQIYVLMVTCQPQICSGCFFFGALSTYFRPTRGHKPANTPIMKIYDRLSENGHIEKSGAG